MRHRGAIDSNIALARDYPHAGEIVRRAIARDGQVTATRSVCGQADEDVPGVTAEVRREAGGWRALLRIPWDLIGGNRQAPSGSVYCATVNRKGK